MAGESNETKAYDVPFDPAVHVPDTLRSEPYFESFKGKPLSEVFKSAVEAHKTVGGSVRIPGADAKPEEWGAYYAKLRPAKVDDYKITFKDEVIGKAIKEDPSYKDLLAGLWEAGLHSTQVNKIMQVYESIVATGVVNEQQAQSTARSAGLTAIKSEYKDNFETASIMANRAAKRFGGDAFVAKVKQLGLEADPVFFKTFYNIATAIQEDSWHTGQTPKFLSRDAAANKVKAIMDNPKHPYHNSSHPMHASAAKEVDDLRKIQYAPREAEE